MTFSEPKLMSHVIETLTVKFQVGNKRYYRGIAKIGFHYLMQLPIQATSRFFCASGRSFMKTPRSRFGA